MKRTFDRATGIGDPSVAPSMILIAPTANNCSYCFAHAATGITLAPPQRLDRP